MLDYAKQRAADAFSKSRRVVLASDGPAGLQVGEFTCEAIGTVLYLLVPKTSDHLFNLENGGTVSLMTDQWEVKGMAQIISPVPPGLELDFLRDASVVWYALVRVEPYLVQIRHEKGWGYVETIELNQS